MCNEKNSNTKTSFLTEQKFLDTVETNEPHIVEQVKATNEHDERRIDSLIIREINFKA